MAIYLKIDDVTGESKDAEHKEWIELLSWNWGAMSQVNMQYGVGKSGGSSQIQEISVVCNSSAATMTLMQYVLEGAVKPEAKLEMTKRVGDAGEKKYMTITLTNAMIASVQQSGSQDGLGTDSMTIAFEKCHQEFENLDEKGGLVSKKEFRWNVGENKTE